MRLSVKLMKVYFDLVYNRVYDLTTARLSRYRQLQATCISKLDLGENSRLLCVGLGTGNEILQVLAVNPSVDIVGVDYSDTALRKAYKKALSRGKTIECLVMDARHLEFTAESFDRVVCIHVTDFVVEDGKVTDEIIRVLKEGGQFVITYPSGRENMGLAVNLLKDGFLRTSPGKHPARAVSEFLGQVILGMVYLPLLFVPGERPIPAASWRPRLARPPP